MISVAESLGDGWGRLLCDLRVSSEQRAYHQYVAQRVPDGDFLDPAATLLVLGRCAIVR